MNIFVFEFLLASTYHHLNYLIKITVEIFFVYLTYLMFKDLI